MHEMIRERRSSQSTTSRPRPAAFSQQHGMHNAPLAEKADLDARVLLQLRQLLVDALALARRQEALQVDHVRLLLGQQVLTC